MFAICTKFACGLKKYDTIMSKLKYIPTSSEELAKVCRIYL
jgi:hypothetical protein